MDASFSYESFREQWLISINNGDARKGGIESRFISKLALQWQDLSDPTEDVFFEDAGISSGVDLVFFEQSENDDSGDTLYLFQSQYRKKSQNPSDTILKNAQQTIIEVENVFKSGAIGPFSTKIKELLDVVNNKTNDRIVLVIATLDSLTDTEKTILDILRSIGRGRLGTKFDIQAISLETIYLNQINETDGQLPRLSIPITATLAKSGENLLVGSLLLPHLYEFMKEYRSKTGDLDRLYEKNVRRFLGVRGRINKQIKNTLETNPAHFGLFNNGITLVVKDFKPDKQDVYTLTDPYIVNGCQTSRTIWDVFSRRLDIDPIPDDNLAWQGEASSGIVVVKIVRVGSTGEELLQDITRFTNSQNAVSERDFITLDNEFQLLKQQMADKYDVFLEIQRGGWDSQQILQNMLPDTKKFSKYANAFDLLKVYGAGWLRKAGTAFRQNTSFSPGGKLYKEILQGKERPFNADDLYAAYLLEQATTHNEFGRGATKPSRRLTRYLFYLVTIDLLKDVLIRLNIPVTNARITDSIVKLHQSENKDAFNALIDESVEAIDEYLTQGEDDSVFGEPELIKRFNNNINGYLKWDDLGLSEASPVLTALIAIHKRTMGKGQNSPRSLIEFAIK